MVAQLRHNQRPKHASDYGRFGVESAELSAQRSWTRSIIDRDSDCRVATHGPKRICLVGRSRDPTASDIMSEPALELDGLARHYGEREALSGVSLSLAAGQTLVVFGPNGAGKTTLLRVLATLLRPHAGEVRVLGSSLPDEAWALRGRVGLLGHEPLLYRELTARENLRFHARLYGIGDARVDELLESVTMSTRAGEPLRTLSRGMVQRVAVARAVLHDPELLLLDEPHSNLDPAAIELVAPLIGAASERTRVICSHNPTGDLAAADVVLGLRAGRPALLRAATDVDPGEIAELYR
jgi:heme exporter protein A